VKPPWENTVAIAKGITYSKANAAKTKLKGEGKFIYTDVPNFWTWMQGDGGEILMKKTYLAAETANQNVYGTEIDTLGLYTAMKSEAVGFTENGKRRPVYQKFLEDPEWNLMGVEVGLTYAGSPEEIKTLKDGGFIPKNIEVKSIKFGSGYSPGVKAKDIFAYFAGAWCYRAYLFEKDFKELYGEEEFSRLSYDEKYYWTTAYFNVGAGGGKEKLKDRKNNYIAVWQGDAPQDNQNWKFNARQRTDFTYMLRELGLFNS
jgi:hypothetical protein